MGWFRTRNVRELGRIRGEDLEPELFQLLLSQGEPHIEDFEHLEFHLSNVPTTKNAGNFRPVTIVVGRIEGILQWQDAKDQ